MIRLITTTVALLLGLAVFAAIAQTLQSGGGATATGIIGSCGAANSQLLFSNSGSCAGTTNVTYSSVGSGRLSVGQILGNGNNVMVDDANGRIGLGPSIPLAFGNINATGTYDTGISRVSADSVALGNGTAGDKTANLYLQSDIPGPTTIASLQTCNLSVEGARGTVTNGTATSGSFMIAVTATGTTISPVFCNGTSWLYGG